MGESPCSDSCQLLGVEIASGRDLFSQLANGGVPLFVGSAFLLTLDSVIPMFKGVSTESKSQTIMSSGAEMWNGRLAIHLFDGLPFVWETTIVIFFVRTVT